MFPLLVRELLTTFKLNLTEIVDLWTLEVVCFGLKGKMYRKSIAEFNILCGFYTEEETYLDAFVYAFYDFPSEFDEFVAYRELSNDPTGFDAKSTKAYHLKEPMLVDLHRLLAFNILGRKDTSGVVTKC